MGYGVWVMGPTDWKFVNERIQKRNGCWSWGMGGGRWEVGGGAFRLEGSSKGQTYNPKPNTNDLQPKTYNLKPTPKPNLPRFPQPSVYLHPP